jgi:filamentous hemagglutinin family protein
MNTDPQAPPADSPLSWTMLAAARRQIGQTEEAPTAAAQPTQQNSLTVADPTATTANTEIAAPIQASADALTSQASTLPTSPHLLGGKATVTKPSAGTMVITQTSSTAVISWQSLDVGAGDTVQIVQPSNTSVLVLEVPKNAQNPAPATDIAGDIESNGRVIIVNADGITVDQGATITSQSATGTGGGVILTTASMTAAEFMARSTAYTITSSPDGSITMNGTIETGKGGMVGLLAPNMSVGGLISTPGPNGQVDLIGATSATKLSFSGDEELSTTNAVTTVPAGLDSLVTVSGEVSAPGGFVRIKAYAAKDVINTAIKIPGSVTTPTFGSTVGRIFIEAAGGTVSSGGSLLAQGRNSSQLGGRIQIDSTGTVAFGTTTDIDVSGGAGGGTIAIGTTVPKASFKTGGGQFDALHVLIPKGAVLDANANTAGSGGQIAVMGLQSVDFAGDISATGGPSGGNGGWVYLSAEKLTTTGQVHVAAGGGSVGGKAVGGYTPGVYKKVIASSNSSGQLIDGHSAWSLINL